MSNFKKGDRVRLIKTCPTDETRGRRIGSIGTVKTIPRPVGWAGVEWDDPNIQFSLMLDKQLELIQEREPAQEHIGTTIPQWKPIDFNAITMYPVDVFGEIFVTNGKIVPRIRPEDIDRTWTHWMPTGITELPQSKAREAFKKEWKPHQGSHKSVAEEWFVKGYNKGKEQ